MARKRVAWSGQALGPLQTAVMESLWSFGHLSVAEIHDRLSERQAWAYTTIHTELTRLLKRGLVEKRGRNQETRYAAAVERDEYLQAIVRRVLADLIGTHGAAAVHGFVELAGEDEETFDALRRAVRKRSAKP